jgi:hypothetical protein
VNYIAIQEGNAASFSEPLASLHSIPSFLQLVRQICSLSHLSLVKSELPLECSLAYSAI